jgi:hypothetical protein
MFWLLALVSGIAMMVILIIDELEWGVRPGSGR